MQTFMNGLNTQDQRSTRKMEDKEKMSNGLEIKLMANSRKQGEKYEREIVLKRRFSL